MTGAFQL